MIYSKYAAINKNYYLCTAFCVKTGKWRRARKYIKNG